MPIAHEKIINMRETIKKIDHSVFIMTNIFFVEYKTIEIKPEKISQIQRYIVQMSMLIPEITAYLDLLEIGLFDNVDHIMNKFKLMEEYVEVTKDNCEELLVELELV